MCFAKLIREAMVAKHRSKLLLLPAYLSSCSLVLAQGLRERIRLLTSITTDTSEHETDLGL